jgi:hypothetical protein
MSSKPSDNDPKPTSTLGNHDQEGGAAPRRSKPARPGMACVRVSPGLIVCGAPVDVETRQTSTPPLATLTPWSPDATSVAPAIAPPVSLPPVTEPAPSAPTLEPPLTPDGDA